MNRIESNVYFYLEVKLAYWVHVSWNLHSHYAYFMVFTYLVKLYSRAFRGYFWSVKSLSILDSINMSIIDVNRVPKVTPPSVDIPIWRHVMTVGRVFIPHDQYCGHTRSTTATGLRKSTIAVLGPGPGTALCIRLAETLRPDPPILCHPE